MFDLLDMIVVRPIVNILFVIYNFVGDFGVAIILFVILVKLLTWPLLKRQLRQTRLMKEIQPELAEIKKRCKGNRQMESLQMMDLYKRKNVKPFRSVLTALIQLPIFMALFTAINVTVRPCEVSTNYNVNVSRCASTKEGDTIRYNTRNSAYAFVADMPRIKEIIEKQENYFTEYQEHGNEAVYEFQPKLFGFVDLSTTATAFFGDLGNGDFNEYTASSIIIMLFALSSAFAQFIMARQQDPTRKKGAKKRSMRQIMKDASSGKEADQAELNAVAQRSSTMMMPFMMLFIMISLPGALVFYYLLNNLVSIFLNKIVLNRSLSNMEASADRKILKDLKAKEKALDAIEAEIVSEATSSNSSVNSSSRDDNSKSNSSHFGSKNKKTSKSSDSSSESSEGGVHITRISASNKKRRK